jgi:hypothetical protein
MVNIHGSSSTVSLVVDTGLLVSVMTMFQTFAPRNLAANVLG